MAKVYIVGAGPGDMELLTLKAKRCVEEADVIVYDRLVNNRILSLAKDGCELIYLGKGNTEGGLIQDEINTTLVKKALEGIESAQLRKERTVEVLKSDPQYMQEVRRLNEFKKLLPIYEKKRSEVKKK